MAFIIESKVWNLFAGMRLVVGVGHGLINTPDTSPNVLGELRTTEEALKASWVHENAQSHPKIAIWREAFQQNGVSGKKFPSSIEALTRRVVGGGSLPDINPLTNFYNSLSLKHLVPAGAWDIDALSGGDIILRVSKKGDRFCELGCSEYLSMEEGEVCYADHKELITRHFVWRQSEKAKITTTTKSFFFVSELIPMEGEDAAEIDERAEQLKCALQKDCLSLFHISLQVDILSLPTDRWDWTAKP
jgi:DNA/RNA-binding domain of Phe-tRNA-synthetase-like protein